MNPELVNRIKDHLSPLVDRHGFELESEQVNAETYSVKFVSERIDLLIEQYRRELYVYVCRSGGTEDDEVSLFNLLAYLYKQSGNAPKPEYFHDVTDLDKCLERQISHISSVLDENVEIVGEFFTEADYEKKCAELVEFLKARSPDLY